MSARVCFLVSVAFFSAFCAAAKENQSIFTQVGKVVAVGDLHGDYDQYLRVLNANRLLDDKLRWQGGDTHLVQLGDVVDRGPDSLKIIRHLMKLEKQARRAGGKVHILIGNHEAMNVQNDLRYVHPGEFAAHVTRRSSGLQEDYLERVFESMLANDPLLKTQKQATMTMLAEHFPEGYVEHRQLWNPGRELARWYAGKNAVVQINDSLFLHGGLDPHQVEFKTLDEINDVISEELSPGGTPDLSTDPDGPLWYRGLVQGPAETEGPALATMLAFYGAKRVVIGHTPSPGAVVTRFNGSVIQADVGLSAHYGSSLANVVLAGDDISAMHRGTLFALPDDAGLRAYLEQLVTLEPEGSKLSRYVQALDQPRVEPAAAEVH